MTKADLSKIRVAVKSRQTLALHCSENTWNGFVRLATSNARAIGDDPVDTAALTFCRLPIEINPAARDGDVLVVHKGGIDVIKICEE